MSTIQPTGFRLRLPSRKPAFTLATAKERKDHASIVLAYLNALLDGKPDEADLIWEHLHGDAPSTRRTMQAGAAAGHGDWITYLGKKGGKGWKNTTTGRVVYGERATPPGHARRQQQAVAGRARELGETVLAHHNYLKDKANGEHWDEAPEVPTEEHYKELLTHLPAMSKDALANLRNRLLVSFGKDVKSKTQMADSLRGEIQKRLEPDWEMPILSPTAKKERKRSSSIHPAITQNGLPATPKKGDVYNVPTGQLHVDPQRFQYKMNTNADGVTDELKSVKTFNPDLAGVISVWKDPADGKTYVVNGHHRFELAKRSGHPDLPIRYLDASDAPTARAAGALINIAEGRGTAMDAAKFMRDKGVTAEEIQAKGISIRGKVAADATELAKLSPSLFHKVAIGEMDESRAKAIAAHLPDHESQNQLAGYIEQQEEKGKTVPPSHVAELAREMAATPKAATGEVDLFGDNDEKSLFLDRAALKAHIRNELSKEVRDFSAVGNQRRAEAVGRTGNVLNVDANKEEAAKTNDQLDSFDRSVNYKGPLSDILNEQAEQYATAKTTKQREAIRRATLERIRTALANPESSSVPGGTGTHPPEPATSLDAESADAGREDSGTASITPQPDIFEEHTVAPQPAKEPDADIFAEHVPSNAFSHIEIGDGGRVGGFFVRRQGPDAYRIEKEDGKGYVSGSAADIQTYIDHELTSQKLYGKQRTDALVRAANFAEPDWTDATGQERAAKGFDALPTGAIVVSLDDHAGTHGRAGRIVKDEFGRNRVKLDGEDGYATNDVEPMDRSLSWRVQQEKKEVEKPASSMFDAPVEEPEQASETKPEPSVPSVPANADPVTQPTTAVEEANPTDTPMTNAEPQYGPNVKPDDIPYNVAFDAHRGTSMVPERRAKQRQDDYVAQMTADYEHLKKIAGNDPSKLAALQEEFDRYKAGFRQKYLDHLHAQSRVMSPMITGPAGFPARSNAKKSDAADNRMQEMLGFRERALKAIRRNIAPEDGPIKSSNPQAVELLQKQADEAQAMQETMKKANAYLRRKVSSEQVGNGHKPVFSAGHTYESVIAGLVDLGLKPSTASSQLLPDFMGRVGFPDYALTNNNANIRRIKDRITELQAMQESPHTETEYTGGVRMIENPSAARVQLEFPGKPDRATIDRLKSSGFKWSPSEGMWQRHLNSNGRYAAKNLLESLGHTPLEKSNSAPVNDDASESLPPTLMHDDEPDTGLQDTPSETKPESSNAPASEQHWYGMHNRPLSIGTAPENPSGHKPHEAFRHGAIAYDRPLTDKEMYDFELTPIRSDKDIPDVAQKMVAEMGEHASQYLDPANEEILNDKLSQADSRKILGHVDREKLIAEMRKQTDGLQGESGTSKKELDNHNSEIASVPHVSNDEFVRGDWDQTHAGLGSELVMSKMAVGMKGIEGREYGIREHSPGKWQLVSKPASVAAPQQNPSADIASHTAPSVESTPPEIIHEEEKAVQAQPQADQPGRLSEPIGGGNGSGSVGGTDGPARSEPARPRIVTVRPEHTKTGNPDLVPESLRPHLNEAQIQGTSLAIEAMEKHGGFLLGDGTGIGKTRQQLAVAAHFAGKGKKVVIISPSEVIKPDWKKGTTSGSFANDAAAMGLTTKLVKGDAAITPGSIHLTTYNELGKIKDKIDSDTILIYDESHFMKNKASVRSKAGKEAAAKAGSVLYATATPGDKPLHIAHLASAGVFGNGSSTETYKKLGMELIDQHVGGGRYQKVWRINPKVGYTEALRRMSGLFDQMTKDGLMIKRELSLDGVQFQTDRVNLTDSQQAEIQKVFDDKMKETNKNKAVSLMAARLHQEPFKIPATVEMIKEELAAGRSPVVFVGRINNTGGEEDDDDEDDDGKKKKKSKKKAEDPSVFSFGTAAALKKALIESGIPESDIGELHGNATPNAQSKKKAMDDFQSNKTKIMIATLQSGGTGVNLDDTTGTRPRTMVMVTPPFTANDMAQASGRVVRLNTKSASKIRGVLADTAIDDWNAHILHDKFKTMGAISAGEVTKGGAAMGMEDLINDHQEPFIWGESLHRTPHHYSNTPFAHNDLIEQFGGKRVKKNNDWTTEFPSKEHYDRYAAHVAAQQTPKPAETPSSTGTPSPSPSKPLEPSAHGFMRNKFDTWSHGKKVPAGKGWVKKSPSGQWVGYTHEEAMAAISPKSTSTEPTPPANPPLTEERRQAIHDALRQLHGNNEDRAREVNGIGFNKLDSDFGGQLAERDRLTDNQAHVAAKMLAKYRGQLGAELAERIKPPTTLSTRPRPRFALVIPALRTLGTNAHYKPRFRLRIAPQEASRLL